MFSPDGKQVCYLREDSIEESVVDGKTWLRSISLYWCSITDPAKESSVHVATLGAEYRSYSNVLSEVKWSPNGSWIGVLTPHKLTIVEIKSGKKRELRNGISSFAWLSDTELTYCSRRKKATMYRRVICRQELRSRQPKEVAAFDWHPGGYGREHWSPSGKFLIFMEPDSGGQYHYVNVSDGTVLAFGQKDAHDEGVSWSPDSGHAFCVSERTGPEDIYEAILFETVTGRMVDCTAAFQHAFAGHAPRLVPLWTVDSTYVLVNAWDIGGHLVHPDPWEAVPLGRMLGPNSTAATKWATINPQLFRLPVPGWVGVLPIRKGADFPVEHAADYSGRRIMPLPQGSARSISPDGTTGATIGPDGHVKIHRLGKWWLPSDEPPASEPSAK